jgi:hypothetical protein
MALIRGFQKEEKNPPFTKTCRKLAENENQNRSLSSSTGVSTHLTKINNASDTISYPVLYTISSPFFALFSFFFWVVEYIKKTSVIGTMLETSLHQEQQVKVLYPAEDSGKVIVSILHYDASEHRMKDRIHIHHSNLENSSQEEQEELQERLIQPSEKWLEEYREWNRFGGIVGGPPTFDSLQELRTFNTKGAELAERLQEELETNDTARKVMVAPFQPIYSNVAVGDVVCAWWHVKDATYDFVIPIQKLPISNKLKAHFQAWRFRKWKGWRDPEIRAELNLEGHDLEVQLKYELNLAPILPEDGESDD